MPSLHPVVIARVVDGSLMPKVERAALLGEGWNPASDVSRPCAPGVVGAVLRFEGIVRRGERSEAHGGDERELLALDYQTYEAAGWTIAADPSGTRFTNDATGHGMFVATGGVDAF